MWMRVPCIGIRETTRCGAAIEGAMCLSKRLAVQRAAGSRFAIVMFPVDGRTQSVGIHVFSLARRRPAP